MAINPDELRSDRRGACQIVADRGPDVSGKQKNTRLANHHAQDVVVLQKIVKKSHRKGAFGHSFAFFFDDQDRPIMRQTWPSEPSLPRLRKTRRF